MVMITSIRAPLPMAEAPLTPAVEARRQPAPLVPTSAAVAVPDLRRSVQQASAKSFASDPRFLAAETTVETRAAQAAEAAREAYIKASIAAGISPLPLS